MKIYFRDLPSLIEILYRRTKDLEVESVPCMSECDVVVGCRSTDLFFNKTIIINSTRFDKDKLKILSTNNHIISRFPLDGIPHELEEYDEDVVLDKLGFSGLSNTTISDYSILDTPVTKIKDQYLLKRPRYFTNVKCSGSSTCIQLLTKLKSHDRISR
jgi:hypothetical protein